MVKSIVLAAALALVATMIGCGAGSSSGDSLSGAPETGAVSDALSGGVPIGSTLATTASLNLRSGASTSASILQVIPSGAHVVTVNTATPVNGFYNVSHNGVVGWSYGQYLTLVSAGGGGGGGGGGGSSGPRDHAVAVAKEGVGFSYWWGHGRWVASGVTSQTAGSCSGSCPNCSHSGSYGADCSGYVAKIWDVPSSNSNVSTDSHPYATSNFYNQSLGWHDVSRGSVAKGDALVYNSGGAGHIFLYESGDGWGSMWAYEAKGCSYGIVHDLRTASTAYKAIAHDGW